MGYPVSFWGCVGILILRRRSYHGHTVGYSSALDMTSAVHGGSWRICCMIVEVGDSSGCVDSDGVEYALAEGNFRWNRRDLSLHKWLFGGPGEASQSCSYKYYQYARSLDSSSCFCFTFLFVNFDWPSRETYRPYSRSRNPRLRWPICGRSWHPVPPLSLLDLLSALCSENSSSHYFQFLWLFPPLSSP